MDIQVSTLAENKVRPTMTHAYKDRIWEPVGGRARGCVLVNIGTSFLGAVETSAQQVCEMMSGASGALVGLGSYLPKRQQGPS